MFRLVNVVCGSQRQSESSEISLSLPLPPTDKEIEKLDTDDLDEIEKIAN